MIETLNDNVNEIITLADQLQQLVTAKQDMKTALSDKGVVPTGGLTSYADAIRSIETGGDSPVVWHDDMKFGYSTFAEAPHINTANITDMSHFFDTCNNLTTIPEYNTSNVTNMEYMFYDCTSLESIPLLDTSKVTNMKYLFGGCSSLVTIPKLDTSKVVYAFGMFDDCCYIPNHNAPGAFDNPEKYINDIPELDFSSVKDIACLFYGTYGPVKLGGFKNLGKNPDLRTNGLYDPFFSCLNLSRESALNLFRGLYDRASAGYSNLPLKLRSSVRSRLSDADIAVATTKGWTIEFE